MGGQGGPAYFFRDPQTEGRGVPYFFEWGVGGRSFFKIFGSGRDHFSKSSAAEPLFFRNSQLPS